MTCPVCSKPYLRRMLFSEKPRIYIYIHAEKPGKYMEFKGVRMYIKEATEVCYQKEETDE